MKPIKKSLSLFFLLAVFFITCKEDGLSPISGSSGRPNPISNPVVQNLNGAARISYTLPDDRDLLYVRAEFDRNGIKQEAKASFYQNYVIVEGFGDTKERDVTLYTVNRAEVSSDPVTVTIKPLPPAIHAILSSLDIKASFGGMVTAFANPTKTNIVIAVLRYNPNEAIDKWINVDNHYTSLDSGKFAVRRQEPVLQTFGFFVRDRWNNHSDTLQIELTPWYEEELDVSEITYAKGKYPVPQVEPLPQSGNPVVEPGNLGSWKFERLFDNAYGNTGFHTTENKDVPIWIPMDLGVTAKLSRYKFWQRNSGNECGYCYNHGNPHEWEIWGTNTPQDPDSWILLDHRIMEKPSGEQGVGALGAGDKEAADLGHEYEFTEYDTPVRYVAWKHIDSWASIGGYIGFMHMAELKFWGQVEE